MGMFDYVKVGVPLPDGWVPGELQSKDFDCTMTTVEITPEGRLRIEDFEYEEVPKAERRYPDATSGWKAIAGSIRKTNRRWRDLNYHGVFEFYGDERIAPPKNPPYYEADEHKWHSYNAKFTDGQLVEIVLVPEQTP
jgi:hypothetical protein